MQIRKEKFTSPQTGWLAPDGWFYPCKFSEHIHTADMILLLMGDDRFHNDPEEDLKKLGWAEIQYVSFVEHWPWSVDFRGHLTPEQKQSVRTAFEDKEEQMPPEVEEELQ